MKICEKIAQKSISNHACEGVTIAFLGDSVTQGCFEIYKKENGTIETVFDKKHSYESYVFDILATLFPICTVNIINAGISGDNAPSGLARIERDVLRHQPDLTVVCYGLNDCSDTVESKEIYINALSQIFNKIKESGSEIIFMTPNMMNTKISPFLTDKDMTEIANRTAMLQNDGHFDSFIESARALCRSKNIAVCDCYAIWKKLHECGADTTELLSNKINHPTRDMNKMFAYELVKTMIFED